MMRRHHARETCRRRRRRCCSSLLPPLPNEAPSFNASEYALKRSGSFQSAFKPPSTRFLFIDS
jgi:hypothetical protein